MGAGSTWLVWAMLAGGGATHAQGAAVMGSLAAERPLAGWIAFEGDVGVGGVGPSKTGTSLNRFAAGFKLGPQHSTVRPYLWIGGTHMHEVLYADVRKDPAGVLSASDAAGVHHRTGFEGGVGLEWPALLVHTGYAVPDKLESQLRLSVIDLPGMMMSPTRQYYMGELSLGYRF